MRFLRDGSGRLTFELPGVEASEYSAVCRGIADALGLTPVGEMIIGPEQISWDFRRGDQVVGLDWDIWMSFMVVAKSEASETLLRDIVSCLSTSRWAVANDSVERSIQVEGGN